MKKVLLAIAVVAMLLGVSSAMAQKGNEGPTSAVSFVIIKDANEQPVRNAAVVMHEVDDHGKQTKGGLELKTDAEGKASFEGFPYGKMRVQVLATGFQTFGADYDVEEPSMAITIRMKRPVQQYSTYDEHPKEQNPPPPDPNAKPK